LKLRLFKVGKLDLKLNSLKLISLKISLFNVLSHKLSLYKVRNVYAKLVSLNLSLILSHVT